MKKLKTVLAIFAFSIVTLSCSKDDPAPAPAVNTFPEENPIPGFLNSTGLNQVITSDVLTSGTYNNFGFAFKPKVNGTINSIVIKLPQSDGGVSVKIWKVSTATLLQSIPIIVATNNLEGTTSIQKIPILKDEEYIIAMRTNSFFVKRRTNNSNINFPVDSGNIKITGNVYTINDNYPAITEAVMDNKIFGEITFNFQQTH